jgi:hypothetical protein
MTAQLLRDLLFSPYLMSRELFDLTTVCPRDVLRCTRHMRIPQHIAALREETAALNAAAELAEDRARELRRLRATEEALLATVVLLRESTARATRQARQAHDRLLRANIGHETQAQTESDRVAAIETRKRELETVTARGPVRTHRPSHAAIELVFFCFLSLCIRSMPRSLFAQITLSLSLSCKLNFHCHAPFVAPTALRRSSPISRERVQ